MIPFPFQAGQLGFEQQQVPNAALAELREIFVGKTGAMYDLTDPTKLWANTSFTQRAVVNGTVRAISDISGNNVHIFDAGTSTAVLRSGGTTHTGYYVEFMGSNSNFTTSAVSLPASTGFTAIGCGKPTNFSTIRSLIGCDWSTTGRVSQPICFSEAAAPNPGAARLLYFVNNTSTTKLLRETNTRTVATDYLLSGVVNTTGGELFVNGSSVFTSAQASTFTPRNSQISLGCNMAGTTGTFSEHFLGPMYAAAFISTPLSGTDRGKFESYFTALMTP